jgi:hypothetical protein
MRKCPKANRSEPHHAAPELKQRGVFKVLFMELLRANRVCQISFVAPLLQNVPFSCRSFTSTEKWLQVTVHSLLLNDMMNHPLPEVRRELVLLLEGFSPLASTNFSEK